MVDGTFLTRNPEETETLGERIGREFPGAGLLVLDGPLGSGKTTFVRGFAKGIGVNPARVSSPSFTLVQDYGLFYHVDLYRLRESGIGELVEAGIVEILEDDRPVVMEWMHEDLLAK
mgnify:FL=1